MDGMLSQEEIDALTGAAGAATTTAAPTTMTLTDAERDAVGEIANINMGTAATTLSTLLNNKVTITTPKVSYVTINEISAQYDKPCVFIHISYIDGISGNNVLILKEHDVKVITDLMMGGDGSNTEGELTELHLSAISEAMNQMMGSAATSLSSMLDKKVDISPPTASVVDLNDSIDDVTVSSFLADELVQVSFTMQIGDLVDSQIMQLYPFDFARDLYQKFIGDAGLGQEEAQPEPAPAAQPQSTPDPMAGVNMNSAAQAMPQQPQMQPDMAQQVMQQPYMMPAPNVNVQPAQFQPFNAGVSPLMQQENIDLIMDVPLEVTVELGRSNKSIKEILDFSPGTIIELNKLAGEPVDVLVNGKFVAKGEVVVIEENFGIRITEITK
ncbi:MULTISPECIES: flagellar motor switch phosphatase FliY [Jutongia]|jgi:flagellar motor switch protein FliN/FliY|uniref:Flagellar motor switch phosphatase FliY n=1 Tax=Jutongia huaianensis TaxID=2763668 RepID=A0ABR7N4R4_9FIRM|nr:flagellar motor switch phosphatase FliY [Jutongia huaianensis]MBC8563062.1 flagellar motor switch phosphatase FliY [Jutongia huaianensis]MBS4815166.1 flagellar motor switch phosphatase FliY [Clostridium sp.]